jgi:hypothetical protein
MIKILLTVAVLGSVGSFAGVAIAQSNGSDISASLAKLEAQCTHRRTMPPDPRDNCGNKLRSDAQIGSGQGGASASSAQASGAGSGIGPGNAGGQGNGIGPGNGGGQGKGRR